MQAYQISHTDLPSLSGAFNGVSWSPEKREAAFLAEAQGTIDEMYAVASRWRVEDAAALESELRALSRAYLAALNRHLAANSRCVSSFVAGPSNFPARRMQTRNETAGKRWDEADALRQKGMKKLRQRHDLAALAVAPIRLDDDSAEDRLQQKLAKLEQFQQTMRAANKVVKNARLTQEAKEAALRELGIAENHIPTLFTPDFAGRIGFPDYALKNNSAEIRRLKARVAELSAETAAADLEESYPGVTLEENTNAQRVRLRFDEKPDSETVALLKSHGFKWSPTNGAWQRLLNANGRDAARRVLQKIDCAYTAIRIGEE